MTKPFDNNDRAAILAALEDDDPENPIAVAIGQRLDALAKVLEDACAKDACAKMGDLTEHIDVTKPATVLDQIVLDLFRATLHDQRDLIAQLRGRKPDELHVPEVRVLDHGRQ